MLPNFATPSLIDHSVHKHAIYVKNFLGTKKHFFTKLPSYEPETPTRLLENRQVGVRTLNYWLLYLDIASTSRYGHGQQARFLVKLYILDLLTINLD